MMTGCLCLVLLYDGLSVHKLTVGLVACAWAACVTGRMQTVTSSFKLIFGVDAGIIFEKKWNFEVTLTIERLVNQ